MKTMMLKEFIDACKAQGVSRIDIAVVCPMCGTVQSARDLINAGAGKTFEDVKKYLGFSCIGRFTEGRSAWTENNAKPCDWTLGGFFQLHKLEVVTPDGEHYPHFELATPEQAQQHAKEALLETTGGAA